MNSQTFGDYLVTAHTNIKQNGTITTQRYEICPCKKCFLNGYSAMGMGDTKSLTTEQLSFTQNRVCVKRELENLHFRGTQITIDSLRGTTIKLPSGIIVLKVGDPYVVNSPFTEFEKSAPIIPESLVQSGLYDYSIERVVVVDQELSSQEEIVYEFAFLQFNKDDMIGYGYKILFGFGVKKSYPVKVGVSFLCTVEEGDIFQVVFTGSRGQIKFIREQAIPDMFEILQGDTWKQSIAVPFPSDYELEFQESETGIHVFPKGNLILPITTRRLIILEMVRRGALTREEEKNTTLNLYSGEVRIRDEGFLEFYPYEEELTKEIFEKTKSLPRITHSTSYPLPKYNTQ